MHSYCTVSPRLDELLAGLWASPVFGDSFQGPMTGRTVGVVDQIYLRCTGALLEVIALARPDLDGPRRLALLDQVAPKSVAFCGALGADLVDDAARLSATAVATALIYLADQSIDRGDEVMLWALERLAHGDGLRDHGAPAGPQAARYLALAGGIVEQVTTLARPEDRFELLRFIVDDTLVREARVLRLNRLFRQMDEADFWRLYAGEFAEQVVMNAGFIAVASMVYSVVRHSQPWLPPLALVLPGEPQVAAALRAGSAACRIFDEVGDRVIDRGETQWGAFCINPCNQRDPRFLNALLDAMGMADRHDRQALLGAFAAEDFCAVIEQTNAFVRRQYAAIPRPVWDECGVFLRLSQRVLEAGWVNLVGDEGLIETLDRRVVGAR